jgi:hypothetical protein
MFGRSKKPEVKGSMLDRQRSWERRQKLVEDCYPGGVEAFEARWKEEPVSAFLRLMDGVRKKDMIGYVEELVGEYWGKLPTPEKTAAMLVENFLRLERSLERRGLSTEELIDEDWERSLKEAENLLKGK